MTEPLSPPTSVAVADLNSVPDAPIWSQSVRLDCIGEDGSRGAYLRLCRYPNERTAWIWMHAMLGDQQWGYVDNAFPCTGEIVPVESDKAIYSTPPGSIVEMTLARVGARTSAINADLRALVPAHPTGFPPEGPGGHPLQLEIWFEARHEPVQRRPGRIEVFGNCRARVEVDGRITEFLGIGQWHEQHGMLRRFSNQYAYVSLRGDELSLIASGGPEAATGWVLRSGKITHAITRFRVDPPAPTRRIEFTVDDGAVLRGTITSGQSWGVPIYGETRPGNIISAEIDGSQLSGFINDWPYSNEELRKSG